MGRHKYRKRVNDITQNGERFARAEGSGLFDVAKNLTKKAAEAALKKGAAKVGENLVKALLKRFLDLQPGLLSSLGKHQDKVRGLKT